MLLSSPKNFGIEFNYLRISSKYQIDEDKLFAAGYSSGGFFTLSLMELRADVFDGFAVDGSYARYKVCTEELHDVDPVLCPSTVNVDNASSPPLPLIHGEDEADIPRPVLYMFGNNDKVFNIDAGSNGWSGYHPTNMSLSRSTLEQLILRNHMQVPQTVEFWEYSDFWPGNKVGRIFTPSGSDGAIVHWKPFEGGHTWTYASLATNDPRLPDHNQWALDFFKSL